MSWLWKKQLFLTYYFAPRRIIFYRHLMGRGASSHSDNKPTKRIKLESSHEHQTNKYSSTEAHGILEVDCKELNLERCLLGGQSFRWRKLEPDIKANPDVDNTQISYVGVILGHVIRIWRPSPKIVAFQRLNGSSESTCDVLRDYFQLKYNLSKLYEEWSSNDEHLATKSKQYEGFRILRQDPVENLFSFICATNNNIKRITQMIDKLCIKFGTKLDVPGHQHYFSFPSVERLSMDDVFECLRFELGFGYRAKYIAQTAKQLTQLVCQDSQQAQSARDYLLSLRKLPYKETCKQLMKFQGIGRKVADCICLMSMDHLNAVPIDCHIYEVVCRDYLPDLQKKHKTLTETVHDLIGHHFVSLHGELAGWSTSILFISELKHLKPSDDSGPSVKV